MTSPIWKVFIDGTDTSVAWIKHGPNKRFAVFNSGTAQQTDDLVLDQETGLIWPRNANIHGQAVNWLDANTLCRERRIANRIGWRLPTVEELSSLVDTRRTNPALPNGHPFLSVQVAAELPPYWTCTDHEDSAQAAWFVNLASGAAGLGGKSLPGYIWPVRGGTAGVNWV